MNFILYLKTERQKMLNEKNVWIWRSFVYFNCFSLFTFWKCRFPIGIFIFKFFFRKNIITLKLNIFVSAPLRFPIDRINGRKKLAKYLLCSIPPAVVYFKHKYHQFSLFSNRFLFQHRLKWHKIDLSFD